MSDWEIFWFALKQWFLTNYNQINLIAVFITFGLLGIFTYVILKKGNYL
jgi:hypothetical protein